MFDLFLDNTVVYHGGDRGMLNADWTVTVLPTQSTDPEPVSAKELSTTVVTPTESRLAEIMRTVLGTPIVDLNSNFFQLGGNSLHAGRIVSRVNQAWGVRMSMRLLYSDNSVRAVARAIDELCEKSA